MEEKLQKGPIFAVDGQLSLKNLTPKIEHCVINNMNKQSVLYLEAFKGTLQVLIYGKTAVFSDCNIASC